MSIGAVGAVGGSDVTYAVSPYLNGITRNADPVTAAEAVTTSQAPTAAIAAPVTPFANPAITQIAQQIDVTGALAASASATAPAPAPSPQSVAFLGANNLLVQAYGAVALIEQPLALAPVYTQPVAPAVTPVAPVTRIGRTDLRTT
jgi:hypothetical protein